MRVAVSPILWRNEDIPDLMPPIDAGALAREIADAGFDATEYSSLFPCDASGVRRLLEPQGVRLISAYVALHLPDGDLDAEVRAASARAGFIAEAGGDVLVTALDYDESRKRVAGSVSDADPKLDEGDWRQIVDALHRVGDACRRRNVTLVFHNEAGTFIETAGEFAELARRTDPSLVSLCLDVGHLTVGGGDAVAFFREHRDRIKHVHLKDADPAVIGGMRRREYEMMGALRRHVFCELGDGALDVEGFVGELRDCRYSGWVVLEQDSTPLRPLDAAKRNRETLRRLAGV